MWMIAAVAATVLEKGIPVTSTLLLEEPISFVEQCEGSQLPFSISGPLFRTLPTSRFAGVMRIASDS